MLDVLLFTFHCHWMKRKRRQNPSFWTFLVQPTIWICKYQLTSIYIIDYADSKSSITTSITWKHSLNQLATLVFRPNFQHHACRGACCFTNTIAPEPAASIMAAWKLVVFSAARSYQSSPIKSQDAHASPSCRILKALWAYFCFLTKFWIFSAQLHDPGSWICMLQWVRREHRTLEIQD